jgi:hypothetical protein
LRFPFNANFALQTFQQLMTGMTEPNGKGSASWLLNRQWTGFVTQRLQEDAALVHRLASCSNPLDVIGVYSDFFQKALTDYQREFTEMMKLGHVLCRGDLIRAEGKIRHGRKANTERPWRLQNANGEGAR